MSKLSNFFLVPPRIFFLSVFLFFSSNSQGDNTRPYVSEVEHYGVTDGLIDNTVYSIERDQQGSLWLGTPNGLSRFDGHRFDNFSTDKSRLPFLSHQNAGNILIDSQGRIWVGTWGEGLYLYNDNLQLIKHFSEIGSEQLQSDMIQVLYEDHTGNIWIGTNGAGLAKLNSDLTEFRYFTHQDNAPHSISHNRIWDITQGSTGDIWVATGAGLDLLAKNGVEHSVMENLLPKSAKAPEDYIPLVRVLFFSDEGKLWVGTESGLFCLEPSTKQFTAVAQEKSFKVSGSAITQIEAGKKDNLWIGTQNGIVLYNTNIDEFIPLISNDQYPLLSHYDIRDLMYDETGILWAASRTAGLVRINLSAKSTEQISYYFTEDGKARQLNRVQAMLHDSQGNLWFGSTEGLMLQKSGMNKITSFTRYRETNLGMVVALLESRDGVIWIGSNTGLFKVSADGLSLENMTKLLSDSPREIAIASVFEDSASNLWIGTFRDGLFRFDGVSIHKQALLDDLTTMDNMSVKSISEDQRGYIWVGTDSSGATRLSPYSRIQEQYGIDNQPSIGLSSDNVNQIYRARDNTIWIGTNNLLNRLDNVTNSFSNFGKDKGLSNTNIKSIVEDNNNDLWVSTASGLYRFNKDEGHFVSYVDERRSNAYISRSAVVAGNTLYFGQLSGMTKIEIKPREQRILPNNVHISSVSVDGSYIPILVFDSQTNLILSHNTKALSIVFSNANFHSSAVTNYSYRLVGFDDKWSGASQESATTYKGLPYGNYVFEVRASETDGSWGSVVASLKFNIQTPWWKTWFFRIALICIGLVSVYCWNQNRVKKLKVINAELERQISVRTADLVAAEKQMIESAKNASLSNLVSGIAHEINTPVGIGITAGTLLMDKSKTLLDKFNNNQMKRSEFTIYMNGIYDSAELVNSNLIRASELINNFKEVSVDQISQQKREFNLRTYLNEISVGLTTIVRDQNIDFQIQCGEDIWIDSYPGAIAQMLTQLMLNAGTHAFDEQNDRTVILKVQLDGELILMYFHDNGKGIPESIQTRIFEPFFTTERNKGNKGLGLQIVANVVTIRLQGEIVCESKENEGTCFKITILANPE